MKWRRTFTNPRSCPPCPVSSAFSHSVSIEVVPPYAGVLHRVPNQVKIFGILKGYYNNNYTQKHALSQYRNFTKFT